MEENIIQVENLSKSFDISSKEPGLKGTLKHFFKRETKSIEAVSYTHLTLPTNREV